MSQQPYQQPGQPGQPGGYPQAGQPGYPQGGYPQPGTPPGQPGYGGYPGSGTPFGGASGNPLSTPAGLAPILQILAYVVAAIGVIGGFFAFAIDGYPGSLKFVTFAAGVVGGLGFGGILLALSALLKKSGS